MKRVFVIGSGIAGLAAATRLGQAGADVCVLEADQRAGGVIRTTRRDGFLVEHGPNTLQHPPPGLLGLIQEVGLADALIEAAPAARFRYVVRDGAPVALPTGPPGLLTTPLLSLRAKLRLLREPFVPARRAEGDESVADFVRRRLGPEPLAYGVDPFVAGIYAGNPEALAVRHAFPRLYRLEQEHGSLLRGAFRRMRAPDRAPDAETPRRGLFSFPGGLQTLPDVLAARLGARLRTGTQVVRLAPEGPGWRVEALADGAPVTFEADAVVWAGPLHRLTDLDLATDVGLAPLRAVVHPPVRVVALGFRRADVAHPLDGFGMLVPAAERAFRVLGALFSSSLFPGRAPSGHVLLTVFVGGARWPDLAGAADAAVEATVRADLTTLLGARGAPTYVQHVRWPHAIPQYGQGYGRVLETLEALEARHAGLAFAGSYRQGVAVADAAASGLSAAERVLGASG